jgi:protein-disulfide isomerase
MKSFTNLTRNKIYSVIAAVMVITAIILALVSYLHPTSIKPVNKAATVGMVEQSYAAVSVPHLEKGDRLFGSQDASLKIFVFEDYTNSYCAALDQTLQKIKSENGDKIAIVTRPFFTNPVTSLAAVAAVTCAGQEGKWQEMRNLLLNKAKTKQPLTGDWSEYINQLQLNKDSFSACLTNEQKSGTIEQAVEAAKSYGVQGAPTIFIGDEMINGARPYDDFVDSNGDKIEGLKSLITKRLSRV